MPLLIASLWGGLLSILSTLVGQVLVSLGIAYVTYSGVNLTLAWVQQQFLSSLSGIPAAAVGLANTLQVGVCLSMLLSALTARLALQGLKDGVLKRMTVK